MSKYHKIRWRESDSQELAKAVRNFNAKIDRLKKNPQRLKTSSLTEGMRDDYLINILPEKVSVKELKQLINTRQDLKREINSLKRFSKKGSEQIVQVDGNDYNLKITKWQKAEITRRIGGINKRRQARLEKLANIELESRGEKLGYTKAQIGMGKEELTALTPLRAFTKSMTQTALKWKWKVIMSESQLDYFTKTDYRTRDNFIKGLTENFQENDIKEVVDEIKKMDIESFMNKFYQNDEFEPIYSPDEELYEAFLGSIKATWKPNKNKSK